MIFNKAGRLINIKLFINGEALEPVKSSWNLFFSHARDVLNDKAKKLYTHYWQR